jgi:predicted nucleic acid-binding protein
VKAVVDTNVVAYVLLGTPKFVAETREFWNQADERRSTRSSWR